MQDVGDRGGRVQVEPWTMNSGVHLVTCQQGVQFEKSMGVANKDGWSGRWGNSRRAHPMLRSVGITGHCSDP